MTKRISPALAVPGRRGCSPLLRKRIVFFPMPETGLIPWAAVQILTHPILRYDFELNFEKIVNKTAEVESYKMTDASYVLIIRHRPAPLQGMKQNRTFLHAFPAILGLLAFPLSGCHDKAQTARMQEEVDITVEKVNKQTAELDKIKKTCDAISARKQQSTGMRKDELVAAAGKSSQALEKVVQYREALEKELSTMTAGVAEYRRTYLKP